MKTYKFIMALAACFVAFLFVSCDQGVVSPPQPLSKNIIDVTDSATLTVSQENPGGAYADEGSSSLIDGTKQTKLLVFDFYGSVFWAQQSFDAPVKVNAYTVSSANDAPGRDPKDWKLKGSNDGSTWQVIDTQTDQNFKLRHQTKIYHLDSDASFKYYRLNITEDAAHGSLMQLSEWRVLYYQNK